MITFVFQFICHVSLIFSAAEKLLLSFTVRDGDEVTLPCENVIDGQKNCGNTTWIFSDSGRSPAVSLFELGQIKNIKSKSDRLSVTVNCSLVIKKVTVEDVGLYTCRQFRSGQQQGEDSQVHLSVINKWMRYILVVGLAALLIIVIAVVRYRRAKANKTQMDDKLELTSNPAETRSAPETGQDTADPEDDVSYASIRHTKKSNSKTLVWPKSDDDEAVTYSTVKVSSSCDPSDLYATVNKPNT
ncbi:hypothetical protein L3Q82_001476 [Scortum barcoo]|uniref:Uncharacterized protein n=1 Tax=Scortum barcoo TaxID=214431 RepID=A0ACB8W8C0_9TELE|nr:hypothetical protein L3Q82_001476 [Scortum barcoo]